MVKSPYSNPIMSVNELLFLIIRWLHNVSAAAWVGGGIFYLLILRPRLRRSRSDASEAFGQDFLALVTTAMGILLVTGTILTFDRVSSGFAGIPYIVVLAIKISLAFYMFYLVRFLRSRNSPDGSQEQPSRLQKWMSSLSGGTTVVILGIIVFLLADVLSTLFERGLKG